MIIKKIVLTGGPCGGKSSALTRIVENFSNRGWRVLFISESATELITGGISPATCVSNQDFQTHVLQLQLKKEALYNSVAEKMPDEKILIVCDRGALDNKVYMTEEEFRNVLASNQITEKALQDNYDAVFLLETAAKGAIDFYTLSNNKARKETPEEAVILDDKLIDAWSGHSYLRVIDNSTDFQNKLKRLMNEIGTFLGEPETFDSTRKYLIEFPDLDWVRSRKNCQKIEITQTYLLTAYSDQEKCLRMLNLNGQRVYMVRYTKNTDEYNPNEFEFMVSEDDFMALLSQADPDKKTIKKIRYGFIFNDQYTEVDVYSFWSDRALVRIEPLRKTLPVTLPEELKIIKDVTNDSAYNSSVLANIHSRG